MENRDGRCMAGCIVKTDQEIKKGKGGQGGRNGRGGYTAHVGKLAEGVGVHLGAQPQQGTDDGRRRRHVSVACGCAGYSRDGVVQEVPEEECLTYLLLDFGGQGEESVSRK
jgi:hypothetical protein